MRSINYRFYAIRVILSQDIKIHCSVFVTMAWKLVSRRKVNFLKLTVDFELSVDSIHRV